ncbi:hypothetical protein HJFPF1_01663 [Paramyrothecium foliicola]|nr:hypothetical protein HJFPF1_01663 [Paramyrothecium foliicola]
MLSHGVVLLFCFICGFANTCFAVPNHSTGSAALFARSGGDVVPLSWAGQIEEGGRVWEFNGTAEEILLQILTINRNYVPVRHPLQQGKDTLVLPASFKRADPVIDCNPSDSWFYAAVSQLAREARYLQSLGDATCSADAGKCARVSCSYNTAIYFCNLRKKRWGIRCARLGQHVIEIARRCETYSEDNKSDVAKGMLRIDGDYELWAGEANPDC